MKIECSLDYDAILANRDSAVELQLRLRAPATTSARPRPMAFCVVLDRSASMSGAPLAGARRAVEGIVRNLRPEDEFAFVTFDTHARVMVPLQRLRHRVAAIAATRAIVGGGTTNLASGWMLGRDELHKSLPEAARRLLLLTDGRANTGVTQHERVGRIVQDGIERDRIRTSVLGFGDACDQGLLWLLANTSLGNFHDASHPEALSATLAIELDGLQAAAAQNIRVRIAKLRFCERWRCFTDATGLHLPDGRVEIALGDLCSDEETSLTLDLEVLPLPLFASGKPATSLEREELLAIEILWDQIGAAAVRSRVRRQTIRILPAQDPLDVVLDERVIPWPEEGACR